MNGTVDIKIVLLSARTHKEMEPNAYSVNITHLRVKMFR